MGLIMHDKIFIFNVEPLRLLAFITQKELAKHQHLGHFIPIFKMELNGRQNIVSIIPAVLGTKPKCPDNRVLFFDMSKRKVVAEYVGKSATMNVKICRDKCIVASTSSVVIIGFPDGELLNSYEVKNPYGCIDVNEKRNIIAFPCKRGIFQVIDLENVNNKVSNAEMFLSHKDELSSLAFSLSGSLLATTSVKGTSIHVFETKRFTFITKFRRGVDECVIHSICFSPDDKFMALINDNATVHIFGFERTPKIFPTWKPTKMLKQTIRSISAMGVGNPYENEPSFTHLTKYDLQCRSYSLVGWLGRILYVVTTNCEIMKLGFSEDGKICKRLAYDKFADPFDDSEFWLM
ncbi:hypothetical protein ACOME3_005656 [Neoechinorhynchus agilis]